MLQLYKVSLESFHAEDHFRQIVGTQFEGHLAEIMWRNGPQGAYKFFDLVKEVYPLQRPAVYKYTTPGSAETGSQLERVEPMSEAGTDSESEQRQQVPGGDSDSETEAADLDNTLVESVQPVAAATATAPITPVRALQINSPKPSTSKKMKRNDNVRHPKGYVQVTKEGGKKTKRQRRSNPYSETAFVWDSSDDHFQ